MPWPCEPCRADRDDWQIDRMNAPFVYAEPLSIFLKALKYRGRRELGRALGELLATEIRSENLNVDRILGVPLHPGRLRARTFNQAHEIARALARHYRWPLDAGVRRVIDTPPQTERDRSERQRFASNAFDVQPNLAGARIAVVDDVVTTGATVNALAAALKAAGAAEVQVWAVARSTGEGGARVGVAVRRQPARKM
jgi:ComF family protein